MRTVVANGRIDKDGRLKISVSERPMFLEQISRMPNRSCTVKVVIDGKKRSLEQNSYYWAVVVSMIKLGLYDTWGESLTSEEVHNYLKEWCNYKELVNEETGESIRIGQTTANLSTVEFEEYQERCRQFAASFLGMTIPLPNEQLEIDL